MAAAGLASVPALPGCMGDGDTPEAALADAGSAMAEWLDAAKQMRNGIFWPLHRLANGVSACRDPCMKSEKSWPQKKAFRLMPLSPTCWQKRWGNGLRGVFFDAAALE